jgi:hypothetical protein
MNIYMGKLMGRGFREKICPNYFFPATVESKLHLLQDIVQTPYRIRMGGGGGGI